MVRHVGGLVAVCKSVSDVTLPPDVGVNGGRGCFRPIYKHNVRPLGSTGLIYPEREWLGKIVNGQRYRFIQ